MATYCSGLTETLAPDATPSPLVGVAPAAWSSGGSRTTTSSFTVGRGRLPLRRQLLLLLAVPDAAASIGVRLGRGRTSAPLPLVSAVASTAGNSDARSNRAGASHNAG